MFRTTFLAAALMLIGASMASAAPTLLDENDQPVNRVTGQPLAAPPHQRGRGTHQRSAKSAVAPPPESSGGPCYQPGTTTRVKCPPAMLAPTPVHVEK